MSSQNPGVVLTEEAQEIIVNLIIIDAKASIQKQSIFQILAELWTEELTVGKNSKNMFEDYRAFIYAAIRSTYKEEIDRNSDRIYWLLKDKESYQRDSGVIIPSNPFEIAIIYGAVYGVNFRRLMWGFISNNNSSCNGTLISPIEDFCIVF
jgi:hypothetical protein